MSGPDDTRLKTLVARQHGLDGRAARLLVGGTVEEVETSATALVKLLHERAEEDQGPAAPSPDPFAAAATAKAERRQTLLAALTGRAPQRRDERGRVRVEWLRWWRTTAGTGTTRVARPVTRAGDPHRRGRRRHALLVQRP
jgi:hypothetical protein